MRDKWQWIAVAGAVVLFGGLPLWVWGRSTLRAPPKSQPPEAATGAFPKAVIDQATHQFGFLDPTDRCEHVFTIRNEGAAPLELTRGTTSCKCTMSDIPTAPIPPGGEVGVLVASKIEQKEGEFSHSATVFTNDPQNSTIALRIQGEVRRYVGAHPSRIVMAGMERGQSRTVELTVYSQVWNEFEIRDIRASLEGLSWELAGSADPATLRRLGARSGKRLTVMIAARESAKDFWQRLELTAAPTDHVDERHLVVDVSGSVLARVELTGAKLDGTHRVVRIGALRSGEEVCERLALVVRDEQRDIQVREIETDPDFLQVQMTPRESNGGSVRLYLVELKIPAAAPACNYLSEKARVRITTDHPVVPVIEFEVAFAVASRK